MQGEEGKYTKEVYKILPLSLRIETLGGVATPVVLRGTPLPTKRTQVFSTANDNQEVVDIQVSMGESPIFKNNKLIGAFKLEGIPKALKGQPEIAVTFEIDTNLNITGRAIEQKSDKVLVLTLDSWSKSLLLN